MAQLTISPPDKWKERFKNLTTIAVMIYLLVAIGIFITVPILAATYVLQPFLGIMVDNTMMISASGPSQAGAWETYRNGFTYDFIQSIDGQDVSNLKQLYKLVSTHKVGDKVQLGVRNYDRFVNRNSSVFWPLSWFRPLDKSALGPIQSYTATIQKFPLLDRVYYIVIPYFIGLTYLLCSLWVFGLRRRDATGKAFAVFSTSVAILLAALFDMSTTNQLVYFWTLALFLASTSLASLGMLFPEEDRFVARRPALRWVTWVVAIVLFIYAAPTLFNYTNPLGYIWAWRVGYILIPVGFLAFIGWMVYRRYFSTSPIIQEQTRLILIGSAISFLPIVLWFILTLLFPHTFVFSPFILLFLIIFPVMIAYSLARYRLLQTDYLLNQFLLYGTLTFIAALGYALLVSGLTLIFGSSFRANNPYLIGIIVFVLAFSFNPLRNRLQKTIDNVFSRGQSLYRERLQSFSRELTRSMDMKSVLQILRQYIDETLVPFHTHIFIENLLTDHYEAAPDAGGRPTSDLRFAANSSLITTLSSRRNSIFLGEAKTLPLSLRTEQARISLLGSQLFVPLPGRTKLTGWICLGPRRSGEPYASRDLNFLESLCDQAALAIERAQVVSDLEQRIHAMNVLTRISQGVNVTLAFDDILELIYAQTNQIIPSRDFRITLHDSFSDFLYHVFYLEEDERLNDRENVPIPINQGLEREVLKARRAIITDDYEHECRIRGTLPNVKNIYAWIGVPLNTGAETIGAITLGSRDPTTNYTSEQENLLQAIADQAAGAIVKARLLQEAERRTKQLTTLNEVARSMSSTLELRPLLNQILVSAANILNCEAGSLLLIDEQTDEMVFEVAIGPVGGDLVGQRLPAGTGLVGKAVQTRQALIANDVRRTKDWFEGSDEQTGFTTNDLLVVPMIFKEKVTGVIEVINRRDGLPFTADDQELLTAFTSQAAVALENARLYTLTDQTLAERVEELSVMQRIDRELNASLDVNRAMRITLDWAMRQSKVNAGLIGIVGEKGVRITASQGYTTELADYQESPLPVTLPTLEASLRTAQPQYLRTAPGKNGDSKNGTLLKDACSQLVIPIRRETEVIGVMLLESSQVEDYPDETQAFLSRLSDHAAIAITNARLYAEVQAANVAKSDFISFVSHELKTPMTSIKGFTDLLAAGVVGPINDNQSNFLGTIRSNVDRMATLVTDLADVSRIEAGRLRLEFASVPISEIIEEVVRSTRAQIQEKKQTLELQVPVKLPPMWGDRSRLIQVLTNLVSNAYKYTPPEGKIVISAEMTISKESGSKVIHVAVRDNGFGISPENQKKIFQKFYRADDQKVRDAPGTGLGLNITKQLVDLQGGQIWFESEFRLGTTFHFTIPIAETA